MSADDGIAAAREFIDAFNAQDHERLAASLNYPHIRLARNFTRIESATDFADRSRSGEPQLKAEGWHHSVLAAVEAVQAGADKVHLQMRVDRCRESGEVYNSFETFWIATCRDGHWGIQFRSSYLRSAH